MGYDKKYGIVTTEHVDIPDDEPVFLFRARDVHTPEVIKYYMQRCRTGGCPQGHLDLVEQGLKDVKTWQNTEGNVVKNPTSGFSVEPPDTTGYYTEEQTAPEYRQLEPLEDNEETE